MDTKKSDAVKHDVLKAVAMRTRVLLEHFCKTSIGGEEVHAALRADEVLDSLKDAEIDFMATASSSATEDLRTSSSTSPQIPSRLEKNTR
jgi:hypothetical protein